MNCKACGHNNFSTASKCASCGIELGTSEAMQMFQEQAQVSKGVTPTANSEHSIEAPAVEGVDADHFFAELPPTEPPPQPKSPVPKKPEESTFFAKAETSGELKFETKISSISGEEEETPPPQHPLYSVPTNPIVDSFIARRAAVRKK